MLSGWVEIAGTRMVYAVDNGWIGKQSVINNEIGDITVSGTSATGVHISAGKETSFKRVFQKWERYEVRVVRLVKDKTEAVVYSRHWNADDISISVRWWLFRENDSWRAYDFENLHMAARMSTMVGLGCIMIDQRDPSVKSFPRLMQAMQDYAAGDIEAALGALRDLEGVAFPPLLESVRLTMIATT